VARVRRPVALHRFARSLALAATLAAALPGCDGRAAYCNDLGRRFRGELEKGGACSTDADCGCYNPVASGLACGGVTDKATAGRLSLMEVEFHTARCSSPHQCPAQVCAPKCNAGRCVP
jgi:hypothetical protein